MCIAQIGVQTHLHVFTLSYIAMVYRLSSAFRQSQVYLQNLKKHCQSCFAFARAKRESRNRRSSQLNRCKSAPPSEDIFKSNHGTKASLLASQAYIIVTTPLQVNMYIEQITSFVNRVYFIILKCILLLLDILVCLKESFKEISLFAYAFTYLSSPLLLIKFV